MNHQGGKAYGEMMKRREKDLDEINRQFLQSGTYDEEENLEERLEQYKAQFIRFDEDASGDIDLMELSRMLEKLEQPKTRLELKKLIASVDTTNNGTINYPDFLVMMLGGKASVLRMILMFEEKMKEKPKPKGIRQRQSLADLGIKPEMAQHLG